MKRIVTKAAALAIAVAIGGAAGTTGAAEKALVVGGSSVGGLYYVWAGGWAKAIQDSLKVPATAEATGGAVANIQLVNQGDIDVGLTTMGALFAGIKGEGWAKGKKHENVRVLFPAYQSFLQYWALKKTGIKTIRDLDGKVISPGTAGGTAAVEGPGIFAILGIKPARTVFVGYADANGQLTDGLLQAVGASTGIPAPSVSDLQASHEVVVLTIPPADGAKIVDKMPYFATGEIPAGTYKGQTNPISALALWNVFIASKSMSDERAYNLVKATFENQSKLVSVHASAKDTIAANAGKIRASFHPGAARYYSEKGVKLPQ